MPLAQIETNGAIDYIHADQTNTPRKMTNAAQAVVWDREQQPFGETTSTAGTASNDLRAPGQIADAVSGLNYNVMRDYDPTLGRYIEADPIGLAGGGSLYGYVGQNPAGRSDPLGLCQTSSNNSQYIGYNGEPDLPLDAPLIDPIDILFGGLTGGLRALFSAGAKEVIEKEAVEEGAFRIVGANRARIDPRKLTDYALNPDHPVGGNKAQVFDSVLGYNTSNYDELSSQLLRGVMENTPIPGKVDSFGARFTVDTLVTGPNGYATVRTGWILRPGSMTPELTTLYVK